MSFFNANVIIVDITTNWLMSVDSPNSIDRRLTGRRRLGYGAHAPRRRQTVNQQAGRTAYRTFDWIPEPDSRFRIVVFLAAGAWLSHRRSPQNTADEHEPVPDAGERDIPVSVTVAVCRPHRAYLKREAIDTGAWSIVFRLGHRPRVFPSSAMEYGDAWQRRPWHYRPPHRLGSLRICRSLAAHNVP